MPLGIGLEAEARFVNGAFLADAGEHVLQLASMRGVVEHGIGGNEAQAYAACELGECFDAGAIIAAIGVARGEVESRLRAKRLLDAPEL
jgi:hypothetical protein